MKRDDEAVYATVRRVCSSDAIGIFSSASTPRGKTMRAPSLVLVESLEAAFCNVRW